MRILLDKNKIYKVTHFLATKKNPSLDIVEDIYSEQFQTSKIKAAMVNLYGDKIIESAYKKALAEQLWLFFGLQILIEKEQKNDGEKIVLIPGYCFGFFKRLNVNNKFGKDNFKNVSIPFVVCVVYYLERFFSKIGNLCSFSLASFSLIGAALMKIFLAGHKKKERQHYRYGVAIINFWFQFKFKKNRTFDFLLDGQGLNKDNTIFLFLRDFDKKIYKQLLSQGYNLMNCRTRSILCSKKPSLDRETAKSLIEKYFSIWRNNLIFILWEADFMVRCTNILLLEHFRWNVVLNNVKVDNFIIPNDGDIRHIGRNVLLKKQSTKAWCYSQSSSAGHLKAHKDEDMIKYWNHLWSYLFYDFYLAPDERFIEYQKLHRQNIKEYINIGSIWSSYISANTHGLSNFLKKENIKKTADKDSKILAVFDTTYMEGIGSKGPLKRAIKFYEHMLGLLDSNRDFFIIAKEKKPSSWYSSPSSISYSNFHKEYSSILIKVKEHPRACLAGVNADPTEIISLSDLVITHVFSSSTVEALGGGRKAIYYDPMDEFKDCYYANIPNLIAHGYEQLKDLTNKLLYEMSEQEYREYLHKHVKGKLEGFIDGQALARFRKLLVAK